MSNRRPAAVLVLALSVPLAACLEQPSLYPLLRESDAIEMPAIEGDWVDTDGKTRLCFERDGDGYKVEVRGENGMDMVLTARFGRLADATVVDYTAKEVKSGGYGLAPMHVFGRVHQGDDRLEISHLDPKWVHDAVAGGKILVAHKVVEDGVVLLTAPTRELQRVMRETLENPEAFQAPLVFIRRGRPVS